MLLLHNIGQLLTLRGPAGPRRGNQLSEIGIIANAAVLCDRGKILAVGPQREILRHPLRKKSGNGLKEFDCQGTVVAPGFVDSHTHPVFIGPRLIDFEKRIAGATYQEIANAGGGIRSSVAVVRKASRHALADATLIGLRQMQYHGTTTVEAKSGYGLSLEAEIKSLEGLRQAMKLWPGKVVPTLLAAHVVPPERRKNPNGYVKEIVQQIIPVAAKRKLADFVDVFCEEGAFSLEHAEAIFRAAGANGLRCRAHVGQFTACSLRPLLEQKPASLDHLDYFNDAEISLLASTGTVATLVPGANYFLGHDRYPDARRMIESGVAVALATDFNPGSSPTPNMQFILSLACTHMRMSPDEAISAATINGAHALLLAETKGSIEAGKDADLAIFQVKDYRELAYWFGVNLCRATVVQGELFLS